MNAAGTDLDPALTAGIRRCYPTLGGRIRSLPAANGRHLRARAVDAAGRHWYVRERPMHIPSPDWQFHLQLLSPTTGPPAMAPELLPTADGALSAVAEGREIAVQTLLPGAMRPIGDNEDFAAAGRALATVHNWLRRADAARLPQRRVSYAADWRRHGGNFGDAPMAREAMALIESLPGGEPVPCHGDFHPYNLLWQGRAVSGVCDWDDAHLNDPCWDVACFLAHSALVDWPRHEAGGYEARVRDAPNDAAGQAFLDAYRQALDHDREWCGLRRCLVAGLLVTVKLAVCATAEQRQKARRLFRGIVGDRLWQSVAPCDGDGDAVIERSGQKSAESCACVE